LNLKIVAAPILAIMLAMFLAAAISYLPVTPNANEATRGFQGSNTAGTLGQTPAPMPAAAPSMAGLYSPVLFIAGAVVIGVLAVVLLFREKT
jgi:hypothetical protein